MDNMIYVVFVSVFVPLLLMSLLVEKKARLPISFVLVGVFVSLFAAEVNGVLERLLPMDRYELTSVVTPISEELIKAIPVLFYALVVSDTRERLVTVSMATGIGFALLENAIYILNISEFGVVDAVMRSFGSALMHGMCTLLVGMGISFVKKKSKLFALGTFALLSTAITYHGIYNMLVQSSIGAVGALLPLVTYLPVLVHRRLSR